MKGTLIGDQIALAHRYGIDPGSLSSGATVSLLAGRFQPRSSTASLRAARRTNGNRLVTKGISPIDDPVYEIRAAPVQARP